MVMVNKNRVFLWWLLSVILLSLVPACRHDSTAPKNIILFIIDGCGFNHIDAASLYQHGQTGVQVYEKLCEAGFDGGKTIVTDRLRQVRRRETAPPG